MKKNIFDLDVYSYPIDAVGQVHNAVCVNWMEIGRLKMLDAVGLVNRIQQHVNTIPPATLPIQVNFGVKVTATELKILLQVAKGLGNKKIAEEMNISQRTVESHVFNLLKKTALNNRTELTRWVIENQHKVSIHLWYGVTTGF